MGVPAVWSSRVNQYISLSLVPTQAMRLQTCSVTVHSTIMSYRQSSCENRGVPREHCALVNPKHPCQAKPCEKLLQALPIGLTYKTGALEQLCFGCPLQEALKARYLMPLTPSAKKLSTGDIDDHLAKIDRLCKGMGTHEG